MPTRFARLPLLLIRLFVAAACAAPAVAEDGGYVSFNARFYDVTTNLPREEARSIADHMDKVFREYARRLSKAGFRVPANRRMNLLLFKDRPSYVSKLAEYDVPAQGTGGIFFVRSGMSGLATWAGGNNRARMYQVLQHEGFHQFAYMSIGRQLPTWANEGLAEYFGDAMLIDGRFEMGQVSKRRVDKVKKALEAGSAFGFEELLNMTGDEWIGRVNRGDARTGLMYDQSWSIVHFLVHANNGRFERPFMAYLQQISKGRSSRDAFIAAFGSDDYEPFEAAWKKYITHLEADPLLIASERLEFLAEGIKTLHERDENIAGIDALQRRLRAIDFKHEVGSHGSSKTLSARTDDNFEAPRIRSPKPAELQFVPSNNPGLPPSIRVTGLKKVVAIAWSRTDEGELAYDIAIDSGRR